MCQVQKCCCLFSLKMGCMLAAGYTIFFGLIGVAFCAWLLTDGLAAAVDIAKSEMRAQYPNSGDYEVERAAKSAVKLVRIVYIICLSIYAIWLFSGILIFAAVTTKQRTFLLPWIIVTPILIGLIILGDLGALYRSVQRGYIERPDLYTLLVTAVTLTGNFCGMCAVKSYYSNNCREANQVTGPQITGVYVQDPVAYQKCSGNQMI